MISAKRGHRSDLETWHDDKYGKMTLTFREIEAAEEAAQLVSRTLDDLAAAA